MSAEAAVPEVVPWRTARGRVVALLLVAAVAGFYAWTSQITTADVDDLQYYDRLAAAFVHGRLDLRPAPPSGLLALPNPYDPGANQPFRDAGFHDLALYRGRFYTVWGPTPAAVLFAPLRLVGIDVSHAVAAFVFGLGAWLFGCGALLFCVRRWLPRTAPWLLLLGAVLLAAGDLAPFLMRRPKVYEVAVLSGTCFSMGAIWCLLRGGLAARASPGWLAAGSLCLGLAVGSRPDLAVGGLAVALVAVRLWRTQRGARRERALVALALPLGACLVALALYDQARFGSPFDTGNTHQLSSFDPHGFDWGSLAYVAPGLYLLLLAPPHLDWTLPFSGLYSFLVPRDYPGHLPAGFSNPGAPIGGLLPTAPIVALLGALPWLRTRAAGLGSLVRAIATITAIALGVLVFLTYLIYPVERYAGDYTGPLVLAAWLTWLVLADRLRDRPRARRALNAGAVAASAWTIYAGIVMSAPMTIGH